MKHGYLITLVVTIGVVLGTYMFAAVKPKEEPDIPSAQASSTEEVCPFLLPTNFPSEYFEGLGNRFQVSYPPKLIDKPEPVKLKKAFNEQDYQVDFYSTV